MFKNTNSKKMVFILLALVLVTSLFIGGSIARYVTSTSSEDEARVAIWGINEGGTDMDLFNNVYEMPDGTIIAESTGGVNDKIIAPGTSNESEFKILTASSVRPEVMYEVSINLDDSEMPDEIKNHPGIQWKLDDGNFGTWDELKLSLYNLVGNDYGMAVFGPGEVHNELANGVEHTIAWQWLLDSGYDEEDTRLGNLAASGTPITAKIVVEMIAKQTDGNSVGMLEGYGQTTDINSPQSLTFKSVAPLDELQSVKVGNDTLTEDEDYIATEGSTIITLLDSYVATLPVGTYNIEIISNNLTAKTNFKIEDMAVRHNDIIPEGGVYYSGVTTNTTDYEQVWMFNDDSLVYENKYEEGDEFPELKTGDIYRYKNLEYRYNYISTASYGWDTKDETLNGWSVGTEMDKPRTSYETILTTINNKNIVNMDTTFMDCQLITTVPQIPGTVKSMNGTFKNSSIKSVTNIPYGITELYETFDNADIQFVNIPSSVKRLIGTFANTHFETPPVIPYGVEDMERAFMFAEMETAPIIPNTVKNMTSTFAFSTLKTAPVIPESVTNLYCTFSYCNDFTGIVEINALNLIDYSYVFTDSPKPITLTGTNPQLNEIAAQYSNVTVAQ